MGGGNRLPASPAGTRKTTGDFVTVRNGRFELQHRPYFYIGTNLWYGCYLSDPALPGGRQRLVRELDRLQNIGVANIRLLAGSETSPLAGAIPRGITRAPRDWDEDLLRGLDFCLAEMAGRQTFYCRVFDARVRFSERKLPATGKPWESGLPVAAPGHTPPATDGRPPRRATFKPSRIRNIWGVRFAFWFSGDKFDASPSAHTVKTLRIVGSRVGQS